MAAEAPFAQSRLKVNQISQRTTRLFQGDAVTLFAKVATHFLSFLPQFLTETQRTQLFANLQSGARYLQIGQLQALSEAQVAKGIANLGLGERFLRFGMAQDLFLIPMLPCTRYDG